MYSSGVIQDDVGGHLGYSYFSILNFCSFGGTERCRLYSPKLVKSVLRYKSYYDVCFPLECFENAKNAITSNDNFIFMLNWFKIYTGFEHKIKQIISFRILLFSSFHTDEMKILQKQKISNTSKTNN